MILTNLNNFRYNFNGTCSKGWIFCSKGRILYPLNILLFHNMLNISNLLKHQMFKGQNFMPFEHHFTPFEHKIKKNSVSLFQLN